MNNLFNWCEIIIKILAKKIKLVNKYNTIIVQFIKFGIVGITNTMVSYGSYLIVILCLKPYEFQYDYIIANILSFFIGSTWAFILNNKYVFDGKSIEIKVKSIIHKLTKAYISYGFTGLILVNVLSWIWISVFGISKYVSPLLNILITVPVNFLLNKLWIFKKENT